MSRRGVPNGLPAIARLMMAVEVDHAAGCWLFTGALTGSGYAQIKVGDRTGVRAHRFTYEHFVGPIPEDKVLDHLCRVRRCVNPYHLAPITQQENVRRGELYLKGACRAGHPFTTESLHSFTNTKGYVTRVCRICRRDKERAVRRQRRAVAS